MFAEASSPAGWKSGERLWLIDVITPFGGRDDVLKELKDKVFAGRAVKMIEPAGDAEKVRVVEWSFCRARGLPTA